MFQRTLNGLDLRFHLAGINNQNFLMRDEQTGSYWQQITGLCISGPMKGQRLTLVPADELAFATWKSEEPNGTILNDNKKFVKEYAPPDWDVEMAQMPTVTNYSGKGLLPRELMLGVQNQEVSRAFQYRTVITEKLIQDRIGPRSILVVLGKDGKSVRIFECEGMGQFYRDPNLISGALLLDANTGSDWSFQGCAVGGPLKGKCLNQVNAIKDYWFDWCAYHPQTTVFGVKPDLAKCPH